MFRIAILFFSSVIFIAGLFVSNWFREYFQAEEYSPVKVEINNYVSRKNGSSNICGVYGHIYETSEKVGMNCKLYYQIMPNHPLNKLLSSPVILDMYQSPNGHLHIYDKNDKKFYPGINNIKLFSLPSAMLLQFPIIFIIFFC